MEKPLPIEKLNKFFNYSLPIEIIESIKEELWNYCFKTNKSFIHTLKNKGYNDKLIDYMTNQVKLINKNERIWFKSNKEANRRITIFRSFDPGVDKSMKIIFSSFLFYRLEEEIKIRINKSKFTFLLGYYDENAVNYRNNCALDIIKLILSKVNYINYIED